MPLPTLERFVHVPRSFPELKHSRRTFWLRKPAVQWTPRDAATIPSQFQIQNPDTVRLFIPSLQKDGTPIDPALREKVIQDALNMFGGQFGGSTASEHFGTFEHKEGPLAGEIVREKVTEVWSRIPQEFTGKEPILEMIGSYANYLRDALNQEQVMFELPGVTYFV